MSTLKGIFGSPKPKCRRNFIKENVRQLQEMQGYWHNREEQINSAAGKSRTNKFQNVPAKAVTGSQAKSDEQNAKEVSMVISRVSGSSSKMLGGSHSNPIRHVTQVSIPPKGHTRGKIPASKEIRSKRNKDDVIMKGGITECVHQQRVNTSRENTKEVPSSTELSLDMAEFSLVGSERDPSMSSSRSLGCQTIDPKNLDKLYNEGVIKYPSTRAPPDSKSRHSDKRPPTREMGLQTDVVPSPVIRTDDAAGDTQTSNENNDLAIHKLKESGSDVDEHRGEGHEIDYVKMNARSVKMSQRSPVRGTSSPLKVPPSYQRGVIPKYLRERREEWQKEAEQRVRDIPDPACPAGHVPLPDSERRETLKMLRKSYADLIQELNMMPVRTDTLRMRHRKMELEKQLNKIEEGIKVFSRPKVFVKIGA